MIIEDINGTTYRIVDERLYRVSGPGFPRADETECVLLSELNNRRATAWFRNMNTRVLRVPAATRYWDITRRNIPFFPKIRIGCKTFRGDNARALFIAMRLAK